MFQSLGIGFCIFLTIFFLLNYSDVTYKLLICLVVGIAFVGMAFKFFQDESDEKWFESKESIIRKQKFASNLFWIGVPNALIPILYWAFL